MHSILTRNSSVSLSDGFKVAVVVAVVLNL